MKRLAIKSFRLRNFKAVPDSRTIRFTPLTVFIGNNGSGKSSVIEGLETYRSIIVDGLDVAMNRWRGFEHIHNRGVPKAAQSQQNERMHLTKPIEFMSTCNTSRDSFSLQTAITASPSQDELFIYRETFKVNGEHVVKRDNQGQVFYPERSEEPYSFAQKVQDGESAITFFRDRFVSYSELYELIEGWQFILLNPLEMGTPRPQKRTGGTIRLQSDGANIAEYLLDIRRQDQIAFEGIIEALQYVLPYARDLQPTLTSELERTVYLQLTESDFKVPGWLLSSGTLRILCILALLRHPHPPPLIVIEEIENGLDPRTIHLIVEEIRSVVESGVSQVVVTTHSPYFLDLISLSHIVVVERDQNGAPIFTRPADQRTLEEWAKSFSPGRLYTMSKLGSST